MDDYESLSHTKWECKYHIVFIPKCRRKIMREPFPTSIVACRTRALAL